MDIRSEVIQLFYIERNKLSNLYNPKNRLNLAISFNRYAFFFKIKNILGLNKLIVIFPLKDGWGIGNEVIKLFEVRRISFLICITRRIGHGNLAISFSR